MPSIGVLEHNQKPTDRPRRRIKRSGGISLVEIQGKAKWIIYRQLLQMLPANQHPAKSPIPSERIPRLAICSHPVKLPPAEVGGLVFDGPKAPMGSPSLTFVRAWAAGAPFAHVAAKDWV